VYRTTERTNENLICTIDLPISSSSKEEHWIKRGVAIILQLND